MPIAWTLIFTLFLFSAACPAPQIERSPRTAYEEISAAAGLGNQEAKSWLRKRGR
jgi:hypothetical protein